jgi:transposase
MTPSDERLPEQKLLGEDAMIGRDRWDEIHRLAASQVTIAEIGRRLDVDRKTVARCLRQEAWQPYRRAAPAETLVTPHVPFLQARAPAVDYSARILWQELRAHHGYRGSYETVKRFIRPLREEGLRASLTWTRFETPPGAQSQIDWGQARVVLGGRPVVRHLFVLTLGFSRRSVYVPCPTETLSELLDAHERAFEYFGGHTCEHLYDRPRTVCRPTERGVVWNPTFRAFADFWGFEPRLCRPYRAQTKGKVESGIKYFRRNFLPGREFRDDLDLDEQLGEWMGTVADLRVHGTTHERPIDRFAREAGTLIPATPQRHFHLEARHSRVVATDYLISFETNRYSVPFRLIGQAVEVHRQGDGLAIVHRGAVVARHRVLAGQHQLAILPEHGPGALARTARQRRSTLPEPRRSPLAPPEVEHRDPAWYEAVCLPGGAA